MLLQKTINFYTTPFTPHTFYAQMFLHTERFCKHKFWHVGAFARRNFLTQQTWHSENVLEVDFLTFTHKCSYNTHTHTHTHSNKGFAHRRFTHTHTSFCKVKSFCAIVSGTGSAAIVPQFGRSTCIWRGKVWQFVS